jgi:hypothetical protein
MMMLASMSTPVSSTGRRPAAAIARRLAFAVVLALGLVLALGGCPSNKEIRLARSTGYDTDFAKVYSEVLGAVTSLYPTLTENAGAGVIKTAWHYVKINQDDQQGGGGQPALNSSGTTSGAAGALGTSPALGRKAYFVRFSVYVFGGKPWRVRVDGQAAEWEAGAVPVPLHGAAVPTWLKGRIDSIYVAIYRRLEGHAVKLTPVDDGPSEPEEAEVDRATLGPIPAEAADAVAAALKAARKRNLGALRALMVEDFTWSFGGSASADEAMAMWQADGTIIERLIGVLEAGCRADEAKTAVTCPPAYTETPGYLGYRAGFVRRGDAWRMSFFVSGD